MNSLFRLWYTVFKIWIKNHFSSVEFVILCRRKKRNGFGGIPLPHHQPNPTRGEPQPPNRDNNPLRTHTHTHTQISTYFVIPAVAPDKTKTNLAQCAPRLKCIRHQSKTDHLGPCSRCLEKNKTLCLLRTTVPCPCGPCSGYQIKYKAKHPAHHG